MRLSELPAWLLVFVLSAADTVAGNACEAEISTACPDRPGADIAKCLKDKSEHDSPTEISSQCADFIALNVACKEDIQKFCDESFFSTDTTLCLTVWTSQSDLSPKCASVLEWAAPKKEETADDVGPTDELGLSDKDYAEKREWQAKRKSGRQAAIEKIKSDKDDVELEQLKKDDPVMYAQIKKERDEAKKSLEDLKKRRRLIEAAEERKRRKEAGLPELEEEVDEVEKKKQEAKQRRLDKIREAKKAEQVNWLPYALGGLFVAFIAFNIMNFLGVGEKKEEKDD